MKKRKKRPAKQVAKMKNGASIVFGRMRPGSKDYESALSAADPGPRHAAEDRVQARAEAGPAPSTEDARVNH